MPSLITVDDFRERFDISSDIGDPRISAHIGAASRRLQKWVGSANYASSDDVTKEDLKNAEAHLAYHFAIFGLNAPLTTKGVVATALAAEGKEIRRYLGPDDTAKLSSQMLEVAREIAGPYLTDTSDDIAIVAIGDDLESAEATTRSYYGGSNC
jgi:hypothetical protein